ncbi:hypothetical protein [Candidatus Nephthysia bennettiae]|uniref:Thioredoxin domain-containing protein n=1 Tax=Candidatus Nephthysia bennettiae TaxID=3127016 RepID=A0A934K0Y0_9BACT|nr:hypothetical protein [Candidatus Dormibacteraeota bacterium]
MPLILWAAIAVLFVVVAIQCFAFLETLRQLAEIRREFEAYQGATELSGVVPIGMTLPDLALIDPSTTTPVALRDRMTTGGLVFLHPGCVSCHTVAQQLDRYAGLQQPGTSLVAIVEGRTADEAEQFIKETGLGPAAILIDPNGELARSIGLTVKPAVVVVYNGATQATATIRSASQADEFMMKALRNGTAMPEEPTTRSVATSKVREISSSS